VEVVDPAILPFYESLGFHRGAPSRVPGTALIVWPLLRLAQVN
jgi:hypothetical protein